MIVRHRVFILLGCLNQNSNTDIELTASQGNATSLHFGADGRHQEDSRMHRAGKASGLCN